MYLIKWVENGKNKSIVAASWITRLVLEEELVNKQIRFESEII
ncbi:hypothetical protein JNUCC23_09005 [Peribacillus sp. JNUCC 23]